MKIKSGSVFLLIAIIALLAMAGCVAPPKETSTTTAVGGGSLIAGQSAAITTTSTPAIYVTPYMTTVVAATTTSGYHTFYTPTPSPEESSCRIFTTTQAFGYNGTAFTFNLKNPPMYINYTVIPTNISVTKAITSTYGSKKDVVINYSTYDPQSYLEIIVRNKETGTIYLDDGFGKDYTTYLNRVLKVMDSDDMLVEIKGNKINATINVWVKPVGNFDNPGNMSFDACTYWPSSTRDVTSLALINGTPTPTWNYTSKDVA